MATAVEAGEDRAGEIMAACDICKIADYTMFYDHLVKKAVVYLPSEIPAIGYNLKRLSVAITLKLPMCQRILFYS